MNLFFFKFRRRTWDSGPWFSPKLVVLWRVGYVFGGGFSFSFAHLFLFNI